MKSKILLLAALGLSAMPAGAQDNSAAMAHCAAISDSNARLSCYDGIAVAPQHATAPAPAAPPVQAAAPAPQVQVTTPPPASSMAAKTAEFGAETMRSSQPDRETSNEFHELRATITQVEFSKTNRFIVTLDNGQVWRQIEGDLSKARFHKSGDAVTISRGVFGSYNLSLDEHDVGLFKVHRIR